MVRIGLLGCGNVGRIIATHQDGFEVIAVFDQLPDHAENLAHLTGSKPYVDFDAFLAADKIILRGRLKTAGQDLVRVYEDYEIKVRMGAAAALRIQIND